MDNLREVYNIHLIDVFEDWLPGDVELDDEDEINEYWEKWWGEEGSKLALKHKLTGPLDYTLVHGKGSLRVCIDPYQQGSVKNLEEYIGKRINSSVTLVHDNNGPHAENLHNLDTFTMAEIARSRDPIHIVTEGDTTDLKVHPWHRPADERLPILSRWWDTKAVPNAKEGKSIGSDMRHLMTHALDRSSQKPHITTKELDEWLQREKAAGTDLASKEIKARALAAIREGNVHESMRSVERGSLIATTDGGVVRSTEIGTKIETKAKCGARMIKNPEYVGEKCAVTGKACVYAKSIGKKLACPKTGKKCNFKKLVGEKLACPKTGKKCNFKKIPTAAIERRISPAPKPYRQTIAGRVSSAPKPLPIDQKTSGNEISGAFESAEESIQCKAFGKHYATKARAIRDDCEIWMVPLANDHEGVLLEDAGNRIGWRINSPSESHVDIQTMANYRIVLGKEDPTAQESYAKWHRGYDEGADLHVATV